MQYVAIIAEAAANSAKVQYTRIAVNGYTDTWNTSVRPGTCRFVKRKQWRRN